MLTPYRALIELRNQRGAPPPDPLRRWYRIENHASGKSELFLYDVIGADPFFGGVSASEFVAELRQIDAAKIILHINSIGGDVFEAKAMRTALRDHPARIETRIDGIAASAASWVGLVADKVVMAPQSNMVIHDPYDGVIGAAADLRKVADVLDMQGNDVAAMYAQKAGGAAADWRALMVGEKWFSDRQAVDAGLADVVAGQAAPQNSIKRVIEETYASMVQPRDDERKGEEAENLARAWLRHQASELRRRHGIAA